MGQIKKDSRRFSVSCGVVKPPFCILSTSSSRTRLVFITPWSRRVDLMDPHEDKIQAIFVTEFICTCKQKDYVSLLMASASSVHVRILISQENEAFIQGYGDLHSQKPLTTHYSIIYIFQ